MKNGGFIYYAPSTSRLRVMRDGRNVIRKEKIPKPVVLVDTREKDPLPLCVNHPNWIKAERRETLKTGDYSIEGMEGLLALERKSLADLVACTVTYRQRFLAACQRLAGFTWKAILVEATLEDIRAASNILTSRRTFIQTRFAAPWTPSRPSSAFPSSTPRRFAISPRSVPPVGFPSISPTGGWSGTGTVACSSTRMDSKMKTHLSTPFPRSYWVLPGSLLAGFYPGAQDAIEAGAKLQALFDVGIRCIVNLMEPDERDHSGLMFADYRGIFAEIAAEQSEAVSCLRFPVRDLGVPDAATMGHILGAIDGAIEAGRPVYVHCWGGIGRTGTVVGCYLVRHGLAHANTAMDRISELREGIDAKWHRPSPETLAQIEFVRSWPRNEKTLTE